MIIKHGKVIVSEDKVSVERFYFGDTTDNQYPLVEALEWAIRRLQEKIDEQKIGKDGHQTSRRD